MINIIDAKKIVQINQEFLLGIFKYSQFKKWSKPTERLIVGYEELIDDFDELERISRITPIYNSQIQRKTNNAKVERIADFLINDNYAMFPTNIIVSIPNQVIDSIEENQDKIKITLNEIVSKEIQKENGDVFLSIIDGQHRIKGVQRAVQKLENLMETANSLAEKKMFKRKLEKIEDLELVVSFFIDPQLEYQAMIFSTINKTQTKVPENLVYSLFGLTNSDSPQKTALEVVLALNGIEKSPFFQRIKLVGGDYKRGELIPLSQATMVKSILFLICKNQREAELERWKKRTELEPASKRLIFREYYRKNQDKRITTIMYLYFGAVRDVFVNSQNKPYWDLGSTERLNVLQTNVGYQALMKLLVDIIVDSPEEKLHDKEYYIKILNGIKLNGAINFEDPDQRYPFTSKSINILYEDFKSNVSL